MNPLPIIGHLLFPSVQALVAAASLIGGTFSIANHSAGSLMETSNVSAGSYLELQANTYGALTEAQSNQVSASMATQNRSLGELLEVNTGSLIDQR
jgi:hypothetical protein